MRFLQFFLLYLPLAVVFVVPAHGGDIPDSIFAQYQEDFITFVNSNEPTGSLSTRGITMSWDVTDTSAVVSFHGDGSVIVLYESLVFVLGWSNTSPSLPLSVDFASTTDFPYDAEAYFTPRGGSEVSLLDEMSLTGDFYFGGYFDDAASAWFMVSLAQLVDFEGTVDLTVTMDWGPGTVATDDASWGAVKRMFR